MADWNQAAIGRWADRIFGPAASAVLIAARANMKMSELLLCLAEDPSGMGLQTAEEAADVAIALFRLADHCDFDLLAEVARKMETNVGRHWRREAGGDATRWCSEEAPAA